MFYVLFAAFSNGAEISPRITGGIEITLYNAGQFKYLVCGTRKKYNSKL